MAKYTEIPGSDRILRYAASNRLQIDEDTNEVCGLAAQAFVLRDIDRGKLSVTWCEYYPGDPEDQFHEAVRGLRKSMKNKCAKGAFGVAKAKAVVEAFAAYENPKNVRIVHEASSNNPAHATIHNYCSDYIDLLELLASSVFQEFVMNTDVPP